MSRQLSALPKSRKQKIEIRKACHSERSEESRPALWRRESEQDSSLRSE